MRTEWIKWACLAALVVAAGSILFERDLRRRERRASDSHTWFNDHYRVGADGFPVAETADADADD